MVQEVDGWKGRYFEDFERTTINYGDQHIFNFYFDPREKENYFLITEEEFFKP